MGVHCLATAASITPEAAAPEAADSGGVAAAAIRGGVPAAERVGVAAAAMRGGVPAAERGGVPAAERGEAATLALAG